MIEAAKDRLPCGWTLAELRDLFDGLQYGYTASAIADSAAIKFLRITDIQNGSVDWATVPGCAIGDAVRPRYLLADGDFVFARTGSIEKAWRVRNPPPAVFASYLIRGRLRDSRLGDWLRYFVESSDYIAQAVHASAGVGRPNVNAQSLGRFQIRIAPLPEQRRIITILEALFPKLDAAVAALERARANLKRYRASVLKAAVEGRLVPTEAELARNEGRDYEPALVLLERILAERRRRWEESELARMKAAGKPPRDDRWKSKYKEPVAPDASVLPPLPDGWCWATMPQLGSLDRGKSKHRPRNDPRLLGGAYPFIQTGDVRRADGFITSYEQTYSEFGLRQSRLWPIGTLCITIAANIAETGILAFPACFPDSVVGFLTDQDDVMVRFVEYFLRTAKKDLSRFAPATAQKNINLEVLSQVAVPLPPLTEQKRIVSELNRQFSILSDAGRACTESVTREARLRQAILKWAFEGKLADQDPNDEAASVLLERIRTERAATTPAAKSRKTNVHQTEAAK